MAATNVNDKYENTSRELNIKPKDKGEFIVECDQLCTFVKKQQKQWVWLALDKQPREIVGVHIGKRNRNAAWTLWCSIPQYYKDNATFFTDFWDSYRGVFPSNRHKAVGKETGKTNPN